MKRFLLLLVLLCALCISAAAEPCLSFSSSVYSGICGREITIQFKHSPLGKSGTAILIDENGKELATTKIDSYQKMGAFKLTLDESMPTGQQLELRFRQEETEEAQDQCLLAVDRLYQDGIRKIDTEDKKIAITFDTSISEGHLDELLPLLDEFGAKCTFFVQGKFAKYHPEALALIDAHGHEIANHSMTHPEMREINNEEIVREIEQCSQYITAVTGKPVTLYRPPSGYYSYRDRSISRALGYEMILWTFDSKDGFGDSTKTTVINALNERSEPGAIILMHIYGRHTIASLQEYLPAMRAQGYQFCTVTDLLEYYTPPLPPEE